jgi:hypothetical protein
MPGKNKTKGIKNLLMATIMRGGSLIDCYGLGCQNLTDQYLAALSASSIPRRITGIIQSRGKLTKELR